MHWQHGSWVSSADRHGDVMLQTGGDVIFEAWTSFRKAGLKESPSKYMRKTARQMGQRGPRVAKKQGDKEASGKGPSQNIP